MKKTSENGINVRGVAGSVGWHVCVVDWVKNIKKLRAQNMLLKKIKPNDYTAYPEIEKVNPMVYLHKI